MSQERATSWVQVPMLERKAPIQRRRKLRKAKAARRPFARAAGAGVPPVKSWARGSAEPPALDRALRLPVVCVDEQRGHRGVAFAEGPGVGHGVRVGGLGP